MDQHYRRVGEGVEDPVGGSSLEHVQIMPWRG
jgi:hypothetical protein